MNYRQACQNCGFFEKLDADGGVCAKYPPRAAASGGLIDTFWPSVGNDDWCGEYTHADNVDNGRRTAEQTADDHQDLLDDMGGE